MKTSFVPVRTGVTTQTGSGCVKPWATHSPSHPQFFRLRGLLRSPKEMRNTGAPGWTQCSSTCALCASDLTRIGQHRSAETPHGLRKSADLPADLSAFSSHNPLRSAHTQPPPTLVPIFDTLFWPPQALVVAHTHTHTYTTHTHTTHYLKKEISVAYWEYITRPFKTFLKFIKQRERILFHSSP